MILLSLGKTLDVRDDEPFDTFSAWRNSNRAVILKVCRDVNTIQEILEVNINSSRLALGSNGGTLVCIPKDGLKELVVVVSLTLIKNDGDNGIGRAGSTPGLSHSNLHFNIKVLTVDSVLRREFELIFEGFVILVEIGFLLVFVFLLRLESSLRV